MSSTVAPLQQRSALRDDSNRLYQNNTVPDEDEDGQHLYTGGYQQDEGAGDADAGGHGGEADDDGGQDHNQSDEGEEDDHYEDDYEAEDEEAAAAQLAAKAKEAEEDAAREASRAATRESRRTDLTPFTTADEIQKVLDERYPYPKPNRMTKATLDYYLNSVGGPIFKKSIPAKAFLYTTFRIANTESVKRERMEKGFMELLDDWRPHHETLKALHQRDQREVFQLVLREQKMRGYVEEECAYDWQQDVALPLLAAQLFHEKGGLQLEDLPVLAAFEEDEGNEREFLYHCEDRERGDVFDVMLEELVDLEQREDAAMEEARRLAEEGEAAEEQHSYNRTSRNESASSISGAGARPSSSSARGKLQPLSIAPLSTNDLNELRNSRSTTPNPLNPYSYSFDRSTGSLTPRRGAQRDTKDESYTSNQLNRSGRSSQNRSQSNNNNNYNRWAENSLQLFSHSHHKSDRTYAADYVAHQLVAGRVRMRDMGDARRADAADVNRIVAQRTREENMCLRRALEQAKRKELQRAFAHVVKSRDTHKSDRKAFDAHREAFHAGRRDASSVKYMAYKWDLHISKIPTDVVKLEALMGRTPSEEATRAAAHAAALASLTAGGDGVGGRSRQSFLSPTARTIDKSAANDNKKKKGKRGAADASELSIAITDDATTLPVGTQQMYLRATSGLAQLPPYKAPPKVVFGQRPPSSRCGPAGGRLSALDRSAGGGAGADGGRPSTAAAGGYGSGSGVPPRPHTGINASYSTANTTSASNNVAQRPPKLRGASAGIHKGYYFTNLPTAADGTPIRGGGGGGGADSSLHHGGPTSQRPGTSPSMMGASRSGSSGGGGAPSAVRSGSRAGTAARGNGRRGHPPKALPIIIHPSEAKLVQLAQCYAAMLKSGDNSSSNSRKDGGGGDSSQHHDQDDPSTPLPPRIRLSVVPAVPEVPLFVLARGQEGSGSSPPSSSLLLDKLLAFDRDTVEADGSFYERLAWYYATARAVVVGRMGQQQQQHGATGGGHGRSGGADGADDAALLKEADALVVAGERLMGTVAAAPTAASSRQLRISSPSLLFPSPSAALVAHEATMHHLRILRGRAMAAVLRATRQNSQALRALEEVAALEGKAAPPASSVAAAGPAAGTSTPSRQTAKRSPSPADDGALTGGGDSSPRGSPRRGRHGGGGDADYSGDDIRCDSPLAQHPSMSPFSPHLQPESDPRNRTNPHNNRRESILTDYSKGVKGGTFSRAPKPIGDGDRRTRAIVAAVEAARITRSPMHSPRGGGGGGEDEGDVSTSTMSRRPPTPSGAGDVSASAGGPSFVIPNPITLANLSSLSSGLGMGEEAVAYARRACKAVTARLEANITAVLAAIKAHEQKERDREGGSSSASSSSSSSCVVTVPIPYPDSLELAVSVLTTIAAAQMSQHPTTTSGMPSERAHAGTSYRLAMGLAMDTLGEAHAMTAYCQRCVEGLSASAAPQPSR